VIVNKRPHIKLYPWDQNSDKSPRNMKARFPFMLKTIVHLRKHMNGAMFCLAYLIKYSKSGSFLGNNADMGEYILFIKI